jgi:hypothetical protein
MHSHLYNVPSLAACEEVQMLTLRGYKIGRIFEVCLRGGCKPIFNLFSNSDGCFKLQGMVMKNMSLILTKKR